MNRREVLKLLGLLPAVAAGASRISAPPIPDYKVMEWTFWEKLTVTPAKNLAAMTVDLGKGSPGDLGFLLTSLSVKIDSATPFSLVAQLAESAEIQFTVDGLVYLAGPMFCFLPDNLQFPANKQMKLEIAAGTITDKVDVWVSLNGHVVRQ